ncbi:MAG: aminoglycoside phosphotransferase family protein [Mucilaginibacter sp.]|nr:aminoglycoside phosphotransferase family protein [Mucilaginibacter sp.]
MQITVMLTGTDFDNILSKFKVTGKITSVQPFGSGHINDSFRAISDTGNTYLLQRINHFVFKDIQGLMDNIANVTRHLKGKLTNIPGSNPEREVLLLVENNNNGYYIEDDNGNYWRVFHFLNNTKSYDQVATETQAFEGGKAFGRFQALLSDMDPDLIVDTIPNFHNIEHRLSNLDKAIAADAAKRVGSVDDEMEFVNRRRELMSRILSLGRAGILPKRIIHNDTKFNNVLLDESDHAQCVIDLDTVMPGYVAYDFGDAVRTIINTAPEDEPNLERISLNMALFTAYVKGYLQQAVDFLTDPEVNSLIEGALLLPYMQGVRFLTDYLDGDKYFKIHSPEHNLQRTRAQFALVNKLEEKKDVLTNTILSTWNKYKKT